MIANMKLLFVVTMLIASLISNGTCHCGPKQLSVSQEETGKLYNFAYIEHKVTISNQCNCDQRQIILGCPGFHSYTYVDPKIFMSGHNLCTLESGNPLSAKASFSFTYAWTQQWPLAAMLANLHVEGMLS